MENLSQFTAQLAGDTQSHTPVDSRENEAMRLRAKIVGVLIRQNRMAVSRSIEDCASHLQVSPEQIENWEYGDDAPSLPQLEDLAQYLNVAVSAFWLDQEPVAAKHDDDAQDEFVALRQRLLGGLLRAERDLKGLSIKQLGDMCAINSSLIQAYEYGEQVIPMNHLLALSNSLDRDLNYFLERAHDIDATLEQDSTESMSPANDEPKSAVDQKTQGIFKLAVAFSQIPNEDLRGIADALLAISKTKSSRTSA